MLQHHFDTVEVLCYSLIKCSDENEWTGIAKTTVDILHMGISFMQLQTEICDRKEAFQVQ